MNTIGQFDAIEVDFKSLSNSASGDLSQGSLGCREIPDDIESGELRFDQKGHEKVEKRIFVPGVCIGGKGKTVFFSDLFEIGRGGFAMIYTDKLLKCFFI